MEIYSLSAKTLDRYVKEKRKLNLGDSELIIKLILLHSKGLIIFGEELSFLEWLNKPAYGLGNINPLEIITTSSGIDLIVDELNRIEFGDFS